MKKENILVIALILLTCGIIAAYIYSKQKNMIFSAGAQTSWQYQTQSPINWKTYAEYLAAAQNLDKPVFLYFRADWCTYCKKMEEITFADSTVQAELNENFISVVVDTDKDKNIADQWGIRGVPAAWFLKPDGTSIIKIPGYMDEVLLLKILKYISSGKYETMNFKDFN